MRFAKKNIGRFAFAIELALFTGYYLIGANGIVALVSMNKEITSTQREVSLLKDEVQHLQQHIALQKKHPFFKEKIAREQLQMAHENEEIYVI
jgi:cell division protein FtsB